MKKICFVVTAVIISSHLIAQGDSSKVLDEAIVTASKFEQKQSTTGKVVTVIPKSVLEKSVGKSVAQLLNEQAGLTISGAYNATGSVQTVFMRGASSGRTLILLDGIPVNDPSMIYNEFDLNLISINDIERIEICKGAQSTLYGSDAIAGVINIITTKKDITRPFNIKATGSFGNKGTIKGNLQTYGKVDKFTYTARFAELHTDGFSSANDKAGGGNFDRDGYDGHALGTTLKYQFTPELSVRGFVNYTRYKADVDAAVFTDDNDFTIRNSNLQLGGGANYKKGIVSLTANYTHGNLKRHYLNDSADAPTITYERNDYGGKTQYAEFYGSIKTADWLTVLAGMDYRRSSMDQKYLSISIYGPYSSEFNDTSMHQTSYYASLFLQSTDKHFNLEFGGRTNHHSRYGNNATYTINPSISLTKSFRMFGSIATGFKAPTIFQLFDVFSGNPDLEPEKSTNVEFGVQQLNKIISTRLVYFHRNIKNSLDFDYFNFKYFNFVRQKVDGLEFEMTLQPSKEFTITANYTLIAGKEKTQSRETFNDSTYRYLLRRPKNSLNINFGIQASPEFYISLSGKSVSKRHDVGGYQAPDVLLDGYFLVDAYAEYKINQHFKLFADGQNLTGKKFFDLSGYNAMPFMIQGGLTFNW